MPLSQPDAIKAAEIIAAALDRNTQAVERLTTQMANTPEELAVELNPLVDRLTAAIEGMGGDIHALKDEVATLQAAAGTFTPEQKVAMDAVVARVQALVDRGEGIDAETNPPGPPPATPSE